MFALPNPPIDVDAIARVRNAVRLHFTRQNVATVEVTVELASSRLELEPEAEAISTLISAIDYERAMVEQRGRMCAWDGGSVNELGSMTEKPSHTASIGKRCEIRSRVRRSSYEP